jgi:predicted component of type VI protein secretion system
MIMSLVDLVNSKRYILPDEDKISIGRGSENDIQTPNYNGISEKHCEILRRRDKFWVVGVGVNKTFLNKTELIKQRPYQLRDGSRLKLGNYKLIVNISNKRDLNDLEGIEKEMEQRMKKTKSRDTD